MARKSLNSIPLPGFRWRRLNLQLFALVFLPLTAILLFITFGSLTLHQRAMRSLVGERDERAARTAAAAISEQLNHRAAAVRSLALRASDQIPPENILTSSEFLLPDFDYGLAVFSPGGELLASKGDIDFWEELPEKFPNVLASAVSENDPNATFSPPLILPTHEEPLVFVASAKDSQAPIAVGVFSPVTLARHTLAGAFAPGGNSTAFVVAPNNHVLYQIGDFSPIEDPKNHPGIAEGLRGESGTTYLQVDGSEHVIAFSPILPTGWALVIEEPWESVANPLLNATQIAPLILVPVLILALIALWFGARQIVQPLQTLEARAAELAWGDFQAIEDPVGGIEEIDRLQRTLIHLAQKIQRAQQGLRGYIGAITAGQEDERRRLARELHDDTIQSLIALGQRVQLTRMKLADGKLTDASLEEIQGLNEQTITDLRRLTRDLRPLYLEDLGLVAALEMLAKETGQEIGILVNFQRIGDERRLTSEIEMTLYRMAQESLSNVARHAQSERVSLSMHFTANEIKMTIEDNGRGFDVPESPAEFSPSGHFGLLGMHERAELIGANLDIQSAIGEGTRLTVSLPFPMEEIAPVEEH